MAIRTKRMTSQRIAAAAKTVLPCPNCKTTDALQLFRYDNGVNHVECTECYYIGPGSGSAAGAFTEHNTAMAAAGLKLRVPLSDTQARENT